MNTQKLAADDPRLDTIIERIRRGAKLLDESRKLGFSHNGALRTALRQRLGREVYDELFVGRAGRHQSRPAKQEDAGCARSG